MPVYGLGPMTSPAVPAAPAGTGSGRREEDSLDPTFSAMLASLVGPGAQPPAAPPSGESPSGGPAAAGGSSTTAAQAAAGTTAGGTTVTAAALLAALGAAGTAADAAADGAAFLARLQAGLPGEAKGMGLEQLQALLSSFGAEMPAELLALQSSPEAATAGQPSVANELMALLKAGPVAKAAPDAAVTVETATAAVPDAGGKTAGAAPAPPGPKPAAAQEGTGDGVAQAAAAATATKEAGPQTARVAQAGQPSGGQAGARENARRTAEERFELPAQPVHGAGGGQAPAPTAAAQAAPLLERLPNPVDPTRLMESLPKALAETGPGQYSMTLQLHPAELGTVRLQLHLSGNQVQAVMEVSSPAARDALQSQSEQLRQGLTQSGLTLTGFEVSTGNPRDSHRERQQEQFAEVTGLEGIGGRPLRQPPIRPAEPAEAEVTRTRRPGSRIDTLV